MDKARKARKIGSDGRGVGSLGHEVPHFTALDLQSKGADQGRPRFANTHARAIGSEFLLF
jgi:hypothetical protein